MPISELSTLTRVIAVERKGEGAELHPRRDTSFQAGDTAYLVGPYHELLDTLRRASARTGRAKPDPDRHRRAG